MKPGTRESNWTWLGAAALIGVATAAAAAALAAGECRPGRVQAILFAAGISLVGSLGGWLVGRLRPREPAMAVAAGLAGICLRFFPALAALAWIQSRGGLLRTNGAGEWLVIFYLVVLATDVLLHIMGARDARGGGARPEN